MIGKRIRSLREEKDIRQEDLADFLQVGKSTISQYETNKRQPDANALNKLADYFGTTVDYILGRTDNPAPPTASPADLLTDIPGLIRLRFANSKVPKDLKDYHVNSILTTIEFLKKLEKQENDKK